MRTPDLDPSLYIVHPLHPCFHAVTYTSFTNQSTDVRSGKSVSLSVVDAELVSNTVGIIEITNDEKVTTQGLQMSIEFNKVTPITIESSLAGFGDANYSINGNLVTISWSANTLKTVDAGQVLFTIICNVESNIAISDVITISDRKLRSEVYLGESHDINNVELVVRDGNGSEVEFTSKVLLQNEPNPFTNEVRLAITSIPKTDPPVKTNQRIDTGMKAINNDPNPPKNPLTVENTFSMIILFFS